MIKSTEEFLYLVEKYNKENKNRNKSVIIGSMDAVNLYPSIKPDMAADIIKKLIVDTDVDFKGIDRDELGRYLRENMTQEEVDEMV